MFYFQNILFLLFKIVKYIIYTKESVYQVCVILKNSSLKMNCTLLYPPASSRTEHPIHSLKPLSIPFSLPAEGNRDSDFHVHHSLAFTARFTYMYVLLNMPYKNIFMRGTRTVCVFLWLAAFAYCFWALSVLVHLIEIHHIFCYMLSYGMGITWFFCPFCTWCAFGLFLVLTVNKVALSTPIHVFWCMCAVASLWYVYCWEWDWLVGFAPDHHY